jgi:hypothetical protein
MLGRFLQTDPVGYKDQVNLYAYLGDDPVDGRDPTGTTIRLSGDEENRGRFISLVYRLTGVHLKQDKNGMLEKDGARNFKVGNSSAAHILIRALTSKNEISAVAVRDDPNVIGDSYATGKIDVGDFARFESKSTTFASALFAHVLAERDYAASHGFSGFSQSQFSQAHAAGLSAENSIMNAASRTSPPTHGTLTFQYKNASGNLMSSYSFPEAAVGTLPW